MNEVWLSIQTEEFSIQFRHVVKAQQRKNDAINVFAEDGQYTCYYYLVFT